jgi:hypothetical protein
VKVADTATFEGLTPEQAAAAAALSVAKGRPVTEMSLNEGNVPVDGDTASRAGETTKATDKETFVALLTTLDSDTTAREK